MQKDELAGVIGDASEGPGPIKVRRLSDEACAETAAAVRAYANREDVVERIAEACWQEDAIRATGKPRRVEWGECQPAERAKWRLMARAAINAMLGGGDAE